MIPLNILNVIFSLLTTLPAGNLFPILQSLLSTILSLQSKGLNIDLVQSKITGGLGSITP